MTKMMMAAAAVAVGLNGFSHAGDKVHMQVDRGLLATQTGVEKVYAKLERQAKAACRDAGAAGRAREARKACQLALMDDMVEAIDHPRLASFHGDSVRIAVR